jgi:hypothetical protein
MKIWDPSGWLLKKYRFSPVIDDITIAFDDPRDARETIPNVGTFIQVLEYLQSRQILMERQSDAQV